MNEVPRSSTQNPEYLKDASSLHELLPQYEDCAVEIATAHNDRLEVASDSYDTSMAEEAATPKSHDVEQLFSQMSRATEEAGKPTTALVRGLTAVTADAIPDLLGMIERRRFNRILQNAENLGVDSFYVQHMLNKITDPMLQTAMRAALDSMVFEKLKKLSPTYEPHTSMVQELLKAASSPGMRSAMHAAIDEDIYNHLQQSANTLGVASSSTTRIIEFSSGPQAKRALQRTLDPFVVTEMRRSIRLYGPKSSFGKEIIDKASTPEAKHVILRNLGVIEGRKQPVDPEVAHILGTIVTKGKGNSWLQSTDPSIIRGVIDRVRELRQQAEEAGNPKAATDLAIYKEFKFEAEHGGGQKLGDKPGVYHDAADPEAVLRFNIVDTLMGGPRGKFPFE